MLLFKEVHVPLILSGDKWQTRRLWTKRHAKPGTVHKAKTRMLSTECFALLRIERCYQQRLGDMTQADVIAEGYQSLEDYRKALETINKNKKFVWSDDTVVFVVEFKVVE
jgi:hypothetical protein